MKISEYYENGEEPEKDSPAKRKKALERKIKNYRNGVMIIKESGLPLKTLRSIVTEQKNCLITDDKILGREDH